MKAEIRTYQTNANLFVNNNIYTIFWDGLTFDTPAEYSEWITEELTPAAAADNFDEVRQALEIATDYLRPAVYYRVLLTVANGGENFVFSTTDRKNAASYCKNKNNFYKSVGSPNRCHFVEARLIID